MHRTHTNPSWPNFIFISCGFRENLPKNWLACVFGVDPPPPPPCGKFWNRPYWRNENNCTYSVYIFLFWSSERLLNIEHRERVRFFQFLFQFGSALKQKKNIMEWTQTPPQKQCRFTALTLRGALNLVSWKSLFPQYFHLTRWKAHHQELKTWQWLQPWWYHGNKDAKHEMGLWGIRLLTNSQSWQ